MKKELQQVFDEGRRACTKNHIIYRLQKGEIVKNPYDKNTEEYKCWQEGYDFQDMIGNG